MDNEFDKIQNKDYVIIKRGNNFLLHQLCKTLRVKYFKSDIDLSNIVGKPFWSTYRMELKNKNNYTLELCNSFDIQENINLDNIDSGIDNRNIQDDNNAQILTKEKILGMRDNGISSQDILHELVKNSKTFSHKTEFAQEKYLRKKSKKYTDYIQILKPNIRLLSEVLLHQSPTQYLGLRVDTLSQIVTAVNFQPEGKYIIYENNCQGLVTATLLNLLSAKGKLLNIVTFNYPFHKRKALKAMNFSESKLQCLINITCSLFFENDKNDEDNLKVDTEFVMNSEDLKRKLSFQDSSCKRTKQKQIEIEEIRRLQTEKADGLIIVCKEDPSELLKEMLQFIFPSRSFVVYNQFQEPLIKLYSELRHRQDVVFIKLFENWLRSYQVLPNRTHPEITMSGTGGYLLTGITVTND
ncbi:hypothetical protein PGB90_009243 [Kerria lacca]